MRKSLVARFSGKSKSDKSKHAIRNNLRIMWAARQFKVSMREGNPKFDDLRIVLKRVNTKSLPEFSRDMLGMILEGLEDYLEKPSNEPVQNNARPIRVFLCHSSGDKPAVRKLYRRLVRLNYVEPWFDEARLLPGQDWHHEIRQEVSGTDAIIVCLSPGSVTKEGFVQREIRYALDVADEKPEGTIFIIPVQLCDCTVPDRLRRWQCVRLDKKSGFGKLLQSLQQRADSLGNRASGIVKTVKRTTSRVES